MHLECCKDMKNFNSMFAIISGLDHKTVQRLQTTWERVPEKYKKLFEVNRERSKDTHARISLVGTQIHPGSLA